jgi:hypothetical protein
MPYLRLLSDSRKERPGMLGVNERLLTVKNHSGEAAKRRCSGLGVGGIQAHALAVSMGEILLSRGYNGG